MSSMREPRCCCVAVAGVHASASARSERVSEVTYGDIVHVAGGLLDEYWPVRLGDGYQGFVAVEALAAPPRHDTHGEPGRVVVTSLRAGVGDVAEACLGAVFAVVADVTDGFRVALPGGGTGLIVATDAQPAGAAVRARSGQAVASLARRFLGTPYLWGGTTWRGVDCSGLVQAVYRRFVYLTPRDACDQETIGVAVGEPHQPGDVLCYGDHVAIAGGADSIIHARATAARVVEEEPSRVLTARLRSVRRVFAADVPP
jgi:hypothetical protein